MEKKASAEKAVREIRREIQFSALQCLRIFWSLIVAAY